MVRILGVALVLAGVTFGAASAATADPVRVEGSLFSGGAVCAGTAALAVVPDAFDAGTRVRLTAGDWSAIAQAGDLVTVPAGSESTEVKAAGFRDGLPHEVIDRLTVEGHCAN